MEAIRLSLVEASRYVRTTAGISGLDTEVTTGSNWVSCARMSRAILSKGLPAINVPWLGPSESLVRMGQAETRNGPSGRIRTPFSGRSLPRLKSGLSAAGLFKSAAGAGASVAVSRSQPLPNTTLP